MFTNVTKVVEKPGRDIPGIYRVQSNFLSQIVKETTKHMNKNFKLNFGSHKVEVIFNTSENAKFISVTNWESIDYGNAITALMTDYYPVSEFGLYLHKSLDEILLDVAKNDNAGYSFGFKLRELISGKKVSYRKAEEIEDGEIYRIRFDGLFSVFASHVPYVDYTEGEPDFVSHNRNAIGLVKNLARLEKAQLAGVNIRLVYSDSEAGYFTNPKTGLQKKWELVLEGKIDEVKEILRGQIAGKKAYQAVVRQERFEKKNAELVAAGQEPVVRTTSSSKWELLSVAGTVLEAKDVIGQTVQLLAGSATLNKQWLITENETDRVSGKLSFEGLLSMARAQGLKVSFVDGGKAEKPARRTRAARKNEPQTVE